MKRVLFLVCLMVFSATSVFAKDEEIVYEINNDLMLLNEQLEVAPTNFALFSTNDYRDGFFDRYAHLIDNHNFKNEFFNNQSDVIRAYNGEQYHLLLNRTVTITGAYSVLSYSSSTNDYTRLIAKFYDANENLITTIDLNYNTASNFGQYKSFRIDDVKKITVDIVSVTGNQYAFLQEIEFFIDPASLYASIKDLQVSNVKDSSVTVRWSNPQNNTEFIGNRVYVNDVLYTTAAEKFESIVIKDLDANTDYKIKVVALYKDNIEVSAEVATKTLTDRTPPTNPTDLKIEQKNESVVLNWINPTDSDFSHVRIYRNNVSIANNITDTTYIDDDVKTNVNYTYRVAAIDKSDNRSVGVTGSIMIAGTNVYDVRAQAKAYDKVDISWKNPVREDFEIVTIYRKEKESGIMARAFSLFANDDEGYTQLFQTNGTIFNDMTVAADTEYRYKLTATLANTVSDGVTVDVKTPKTVVNGGGSELDEETNEYVITWDKPTTGQIKVMIAGVQYQIVPAANKETRIPAASMKFDLLGRPDVQLIPIDESGNEGLPSSPGGGSSGGGGGLGNVIGGATVNDILNAPNLLLAGVGLLSVIGGFILLGLAFLIVPKLVATIVNAYHARRLRKG